MQLPSGGTAVTMRPTVARFSTAYRGMPIGHYELSPIPGNQFVCISHRTYIKPEFRGKGFGKRQHYERLAVARKMGYTYIMATVRIDNGREEKILMENGWLRLHDHVSTTEDGHPVCLWGKSLV